MNDKWYIRKERMWRKKKRNVWLKLILEWMWRKVNMNGVKGIWENWLDITEIILSEICNLYRSKSWIGKIPTIERQFLNGFVKLEKIIRDLCKGTKCSTAVSRERRIYCYIWKDQTYKIRIFCNLELWKKQNRSLNNHILNVLNYWTIFTFRD